MVNWAREHLLGFLIHDAMFNDVVAVVVVGILNDIIGQREACGLIARTRTTSSTKLKADE
jgi:hypothetical protein